MVENVPEEGGSKAPFWEGAGILDLWSRKRTGETGQVNPDHLRGHVSWALPWTPSWDVSWELSWGVLQGLRTQNRDNQPSWALSWGSRGCSRGRSRGPSRGASFFNPYIMSWRPLMISPMSYLHSCGSFKGHNGLQDQGTHRARTHTHTQGKLRECHSQSCMLRYRCTTKPPNRFYSPLVF